jgi:hypothetical protein
MGRMESVSMRFVYNVEGLERSRGGWWRASLLNGIFGAQFSRVFAGLDVFLVNVITCLRMTGTLQFSPGQRTRQHLISATQSSNAIQWIFFENRIWTLTRIGLGMIVHCHVSVMTTCSLNTSISSASIPSADDGETVSTKDISDFRLDPADTDDNFNLDTLFNQYLRSPSPPLASLPTGAINESSGITLTDAECEGHRCIESYNDPATDVRVREGARTEAGDRCGISIGSRIRLRVSQPKIMLRFRLRDMNQHADR